MPPVLIIMSIGELLDTVCHVCIVSHVVMWFGAMR